MYSGARKRSNERKHEQAMNLVVGPSKGVITSVVHSRPSSPAKRLSGVMLSVIILTCSLVSVYEFFGPDQTQDIIDTSYTKLNPAEHKPNSFTDTLPDNAGVTARRRTTDAGVDVSAPELYSGVDLKGDSSTATVMGIATGYELSVYQRLVGTLRKSGYNGHIILGVGPDVSAEVLRYFRYRDVIWHKLEYMNCTYSKNDVFNDKLCVHPYPDIKTRWSRFPLQRDWLEECKTCTGPVLVMDIRDAFFQKDPFGPGSPVVKGLQVFEEHKNQTTRHWLAEIPIQKCKGIGYDETMLCSGSTIGTRAAMLKYLEVMHAEMQVWIKDKKCWFGMHGDDQSIHNYLFYSGQLPFATAIANREGGIVNTVGVEGSVVFEQHVATKQKMYNISRSEAGAMDFDGSDGRNRWIGGDIIDDEGFFTEFDGSRSRVIHQWDRWGTPYMRWVSKQEFLKDKAPSDFK